MNKLMVAGGAVVVFGLAGYTMMPAPDPAAAAAEAQAAEAERARAEAERLDAIIRSGMTPLRKAQAYAEALDPQTRADADMRLSNATLAAINATRIARERYPMTDAEIPEYRRTVEPMRKAALVEWERAMEELYGPTWRALHEARGGQLAQAGGERFGYPGRP